ncbi:MAG: CHAT domain-containing protein [Cyanobacteria bacterium P01_G01_bin.54]
MMLHWSVAIAFGCTLGIFPAFPVWAQSVTAAPDGTGTRITIEGNTYHIQGGTPAGANLFHSFQEFGLSSGAIANFLSNPGINNIFGRVVGGNASMINGLIQAKPNLYLMNPAGIVFGSNASLNVGGDFFATTANQICFAGDCFNAVGFNDYATLQGNPTTLGFLHAQPGGLINAGTLDVLKGKSIHLSGGTVVNMGQILAPSGMATVAAVPGARRVRLNQPGDLLSLELTQDVLTEGINPLALPELLTGARRHTTPLSEPLANSHLGDVVMTGAVTAAQVDLYATRQVTPSEASLIQGDTRVVRFSAEGDNPNQAVFIDRRADHPEQLLFGAEAGTVSQIIERDEAGIEKISEQLGAIRDAVGELDSVAIVAEGNEGSFWLGNQWIRAENIDDHAAQLQQWGAALSERADVLLYSCFTALGASGEALVQGIATLTGADVAASVNVTGSANYGGDWALESRTGTIEARNPFTTETLDTWDGKLATRTVQNLNDTGSGSLRDALTGTGGGSSFWAAAVANGDEINFAPGVVGQIDIGTEIVWTAEDLTLDGPGQNDLILDGGGSGRIFNITANEATISDVTIRNGSVGGLGGGIYSSGNLALTNAVVSGNSAGAGGGITSAGTIELTDSVISGNSSANGGGGIFSQSHATLNDSAVSGNSVGGYGGGINNYGNVALTNAEISGNSAGMGGGGISSRGNVVLTDSAVSGNSAGNVGGGISNSGAVTLTDSAVSGNSAGRYGGGISSNGDIELTDSAVSGNSTGRYGGGIYNLGNVTLTDSQVSGNSTSQRGGGISSLGNVALTDSVLSDNSAGDVGGGIFNTRNIELTNSVLSGNSVGNAGGGISSLGNVALTDSVLSSNSAGRYGGGINNYGTVTLNDSVFSGNLAGIDGGGINSRSNVELTNSVLSGNSAGQRGGGITSRGNVELTRSVLSSNSAGLRGGGIYIVSIVNSVQATLTNSILTGNQADSSDDGDGIYAKDSTVRLENDGDLYLSDSIATNDGSTSTISLTGNSIVLATPIQSNGADIEIMAQQNVQALTADATISSTGITGGDITIHAGNNLQLRNVLAFGTNGDGGNISITSTRGFATTTFGGSEGVLNASGNNGNAGNITINAAGTLTLGQVFAEGIGGAGGNVVLESPEFIRLTGTGSGLLSSGTSISTASNIANGRITIRHGGRGLVPFTIGDAAINGAAGRLSAGTSSGQILSPTLGFLYDFSQGGIQIISGQTGELPAITPFPIAESNPPALEFYGESPIELFLKLIAKQLNAEITIDADTSTATLAIQGEETPFLVPFVNEAPEDPLPDPSNDLNLSAIDELLENEYIEEDVGSPVTLASIQETLTTIEQQTGTRSVLIYALSNPDALELIVVTPDHQLLHRVIPEADRDTLHRTIRIFRRHIISLSPNYLSPAQQLYDWLIRPIEGVLDNLNIDTLVFAMGDGLRTLPMSALHDGEQFLVEKYSLGQIPSLSLTDSSYVPLQDANVLAMGASQFDFLDPLPAVPSELALITHLKSGEQHLNPGFTWENLRNQSRDRNFEIVHLATHATFKPGAATNSYIQLWGDDQISVDELRELRWFEDPQVELLVLSACETAFGDPHAELGFAGLAVQAGVKSTLASLWQISDLGTMRLMREFYEQLGNPDVTIKAEALRQAQLALLRGEATAQNALLEGMTLPPELVRYTNTDLTHPFYWSAFTLVGSPW